MIHDSLKNENPSMQGNSELKITSRNRLEKIFILDSRIKDSIYFGKITEMGKTLKWGNVRFYT